MSLAKKIHLRDSESILEVCRRYWLTLIFGYMVGVFLLGLSAFLMFQLFSYGFWGQILFGVGVLVGLFFIFRIWFFSHHNALVITTERVVDIDRAGWFDEIISSLSYKDIVEAVVRKKGFLANLFNYGSVEIVGREDGMILDIIKIRQPQRVQSLLEETAEECRRCRQTRNVHSVCRAFVKIIPEMDEEILRETVVLIEEHLETRDSGDKEDEAETPEDEI